MSSRDLFAPERAPWIDRPGADVDAYVDALVAERGERPEDTELRRRLTGWRDEGYVVLRNAAPVELIDAYRADLAALTADHRAHEVLVNCSTHGVVPIRELEPEELDQPHLRFLDFHNASTAGKKLALNRPVVSFLRHVFGHPVVAMQTLTFRRGSQQSAHQDYAYVVAEIPTHLAACWIALEDVHPDAGPVAYYPGSHRIPRFDFGDGPFLTENSPKREVEFAAHIENACLERNLPLIALEARKGDILIWHGALVHRGLPVRDPRPTRESLVVHYSSEVGYPHERRNPRARPVRYYWNEAFCYGDPIRPHQENAFRAGGGLEGHSTQST